ncbi:hypothetical protein Ancab_028500 [Ancistrocladus abbreviatus]
MVQNFIEESSDKQSVAKGGWNHCNCFNGNNSDNSDDEFDAWNDSFPPNASYAHDACNILKISSLVPCTSISERNLLADIAKIGDIGGLDGREIGDIGVSKSFLYASFPALFSFLSLTSFSSSDSSIGSGSGSGSFTVSSSFGGGAEPLKASPHQ